LIALLINTGVLGFWYKWKFEKEKQTLERQSYISKARFDTEFAAYQRITEAFWNIAICAINISDGDNFTDIQFIEQEADALYAKRWDEYYKKCKIGHDVFYQNAAFVHKTTRDVFYSFMSKHRLGDYDVIDLEILGRWSYVEQPNADWQIAYNILNNDIPNVIQARLDEISPK